MGSWWWWWWWWWWCVCVCVWGGGGGLVLINVVMFYIVTFDYLHKSRHRLEYRFVFGDVRAMKRRHYGDIHRWIGDVHGASANNPLIFGNSSAIVRRLPLSIGIHRRTFDLWKYRIFAKHRRILPIVSLTFTNASPNYRRMPSIIRFDCKLTSCQYREQSRQIATIFHRETSGDVADANVTGALAYIRGSWPPEKLYKTNKTLFSQWQPVTLTYNSTWLQILNTLAYASQPFLIFL